MRIDEVSEHIGEEWLAGGYRHPGHVRIDGIEVVEQKRGYRYMNTQRVRYVRVTKLLDDSSPQLYDGTVVTALIAARDLEEPWTDYWARESIRREQATRRRDLVDRINAHLPDEAQHVFTTWGGTGGTIPLAGLENLADQLDLLTEVMEENARLIEQVRHLS